MVFVSVLVDLVRSSRQERVGSDRRSSSASASSSSAPSSSTATNAATTAALLDLASSPAASSTGAGGMHAESSSDSEETSMRGSLTMRSFHPAPAAMTAAPPRGRWVEALEYRERAGHRNSLDTFSAGSVGSPLSDSTAGLSSASSAASSSPSRSRSPSPGRAGGNTSHYSSSGGSGSEWWIGATAADGQPRFYRVRSRSPSPDKI